MSNDLERRAEQLKSIAREMDELARIEQCDTDDLRIVFVDSYGDFNEIELTDEDDKELIALFKKVIARQKKAILARVTPMLDAI